MKNGHTIRFYHRLSLMRFDPFYNNSHTLRIHTPQDEKYASHSNHITNSHMLIHFGYIVWISNSNFDTTNNLSPHTNTTCISKHTANSLICFYCVSFLIGKSYFNQNALHLQSGGWPKFPYFIVVVLVVVA